MRWHISANCGRIKIRRMFKLSVRLYLLLLLYIDPAVLRCLSPAINTWQVKYALPCTRPMRDNTWWGKWHFMHRYSTCKYICTDHLPDYCVDSCTCTSAFLYINQLQWNLGNRDTQGTVKNCPQFWGGPISQVHLCVLNRPRDWSSCP